MRKLVIKSSEWLRGNSFNSCLCNENGKKCCIGIMLSQLGLTNDQLMPDGHPIGMPSLLFEYDCPAVPEGAEWLLSRWLSDAYDCTLAININDKQYAEEWQGDDDRINELRPVFARNGWEVEWRPNE